jgi:hypothetical protein
VRYPERYHPLGKGLNNVWEIHIPTQGSWGNGSIEHACPLPTELTKRVILLSTTTSGLAFDPFAGTGASIVAAQALGRSWVAMDINHRYRDMCCKRLSEECAGQPQDAKAPASLRHTNLLLRQLKYPVLLYKRIAPGLRLTAADVPLLAVRRGTHCRRASPNWVTRGQIVVAVSKRVKQTRLRQLTAAIKEARHIPPLSKFQIETDVWIVRHQEFAELNLFPSKRKVHLYTRGHFWRAARELTSAAIGQIRNPSNFPLLVSDIRVDEQPAY